MPALRGIVAGIQFFRVEPAVSSVTVDRRLSAVLIADVVGYARLMERNETGTHTRLRAVRDEVTDPAIRDSQGRIVRTVGDGLLVEFPSATAALRAATRIQREMRARNAGLPQEERIDYRIGINLGDIIITPEDIEGDGVNLAARLQALADPGGICISQSVREQAREDLGVDFVDAGEQRVKNISRPVRVYRVALEPLTGWDRFKAGARRGRRDAGLRGAVAGLLVIGLAAAGATIWWSQRHFSPPRLSVAAVPFSTIPSDVQNAQLALALAAELRNGLARLAGGGLFTVPKVETVKSTDLRDIARELNVRHVLTGTLKRSADRLDVMAQLVDGETGTAIWSDQFSLAQDASNRADRIAAARLSAAMRLELLRDEARRAEKKRTADRDATDLGAAAYVTLYGPGYSDRQRLKDLIAALAVGLTREPNNVLALVTRAELLNYEMDYLSPEEAKKLKTESMSLSNRALALAPNDSEVWMSYASSLEMANDDGAALEAAQRAVELDPFNPYAAVYRARLLMRHGRLDMAVRQAREAADIAPQMQDLAGSAAFVECQSTYYKGSYAEAKVACERATGLGVGGYVTSMILAAVYLHLNEPAKAQTAREKALQEFPGLRLATFFAERDDGPLGQHNLAWKADLRKAGFPE